MSVFVLLVVPGRPRGELLGSHDSDHHQGGLFACVDPGAALSPLVLTVVVFIMAVYRSAFTHGRDRRSGSEVRRFISGLQWRRNVVWGLDKLTIFANWILFLIFAFSRWPGCSARTQTRGEIPPLPPSAGSLRHSTDVRRPESAPAFGRFESSSQRLRRHRVARHVRQTR